MAKLSKCVALAPLGTDMQLPPAASDLRRPDVRSFFSYAAKADGARTSWVRLWADWADLQAEGPASLRLDLLDAIADCIAVARSQGKRVILSTRSFPEWANGTAGIFEAATDAGFDPGVNGWSSTLADRRAPNGKSMKKLRFRYPGDAKAGAESIDVGPGSAWHLWINFLAVWFNPQRGALHVPEPYGSMLSGVTPRPDAYIDCLEFVNEPNGYELWPQRDGQNRPIAHEVVAKMFATVKTIDVALAGAPGPVFLGPATDDYLGKSTRMRTSVDEFTELLLLALKRDGFVPGPRFAWTHHNYTDVTRDCRLPPTAEGKARRTRKGSRDPRTHRAALVRRLLVRHQWAGWPSGKPGDPRIMLTEGGVQRSKVRVPKHSSIDAEQARLLKRAHRRLADESGLGAGIDMFTHFLFYTRTDFDSGLVDQPAGHDIPAPRTVRRLKRPAYYAWREMSERKSR